MARERLRRFGVGVFWVLIGGLVIGGFFISAFVPTYSAIPAFDQGVALLFAPLFSGFILGILLADYELQHVAAASFAMVSFTLVLVGVFIFVPILADLPAVVEVLSLFAVRQIALSAVLIFPLAITGSVVGHGFVVLSFPPQGQQREILALREQTRRWHEALDRIEKRRETPESYRTREVSPPEGEGRTEEK